mgnify:CR=1 FL=1
MGKMINIAIDGHSSCGKSTIAKAISKRYQMKYIDTGAMYRAVSWYCIQNHLISEDGLKIEKLKEDISEIKVEFRYNFDTKSSETFLNDENVEGYIRTLEVSEKVSLVAKIPFVREKLVILQKEIGKDKNVVMDGRDIGTKVFPDADLKFFITAQVDIRAKRRWEELKDNGEKVSFDKVLENLKMRDENDVNRKINPLKKADDAVLIDNSDISLADQNNFIFSIIDKNLKNECRN